MPTRAVLLTLALVLVVGACSAPEDRARTRDRALAGALVDQAETLLEEGRTQEALVAAARARQAARGTGAPLTEARALHLVGVLDDDPGALLEAARLLDEVPPGPPAWRVRLGLTGLAVEQGAVVTARLHLERLLEETEDWPDHRERSRARAPALHLHAGWHRAEGRAAEAYATERQAQLALTLLDDRELQPLRMAVQLDLGDDLATRGDDSGAFEAHARAAALAQGLGDGPAEVKATWRMARDLAGMRRFADAADQGQRALELAAVARDPSTARAIAAEALAWCERLGSRRTEARRRAILDVLAEVAAQQGG